jgi:adenosylcobinamide kinase/adenosylcobinamide-phosphate guanylyltransferase
VKKVLVVTGGARSGKSRYAESRAMEMGRRLLYVATAEPKDSEMARRIAEHQKSRGKWWKTVEEPIDITRSLTRYGRNRDCVLIECVTLWLSNVLLQKGEARVAPELDAVLQLISKCEFPLIFVTNEVGSGIVPDTPMARRFAELAGQTNQRIAAAADEVVLMVAGIPVTIKK